MSPEQVDDELPRLLLIADKFSDPRVETVVERIVEETPLRWVQLRDHRARRALFRGRADCMAERLRAARSDLLISVNADVGLARNIGAGLHLGVRGPSVADARGELGGDRLIGYSAHDLNEALRAAEEGADYVTFSPIYPTPSKPDHPGEGLDALSEVCARLTGTPVIALGGITPDRVQRCLEAGAYGVAVLSGILAAPDPIRSAGDYLAALEESVTH